MPEVTPDSAQTCELLELIRRGDAQALERLLDRHRADLLDFVALHLDPRLRTRFDPSDVAQMTQMEVAKRMGDFLDKNPMPFRLWLRRKAHDKMLNLYRDHVTRIKRSVKREEVIPDRSSVLLAQPLLAARGPSPSQQAEAKELAERLSRATAELSETDREILLLRQAEKMPFEEIAFVLDMEPAAARKRFGRALIRLQTILVKEGLLEPES